MLAFLLEHRSAGGDIIGPGTDKQNDGKTLLRVSLGPLAAVAWRCFDKCLTLLRKLTISQTSRHRSMPSSKCRAAENPPNGDVHECSADGTCLICMFLFLTLYLRSRESHVQCLKSIASFRTLDSKRNVFDKLRVCSNPQYRTVRRTTCLEDLHLAMAARSYVWPSALTTGSVITLCVIGHTKMLNVISPRGQAPNNRSSLTTGSCGGWETCGRARRASWEPHEEMAHRSPERAPSNNSAMQWAFMAQIRASICQRAHPIHRRLQAHGDVLCHCCGTFLRGHRATALQG